MSADGSQVLMIHRNTREEDEHFGKYNGLGGKLERDEDVVSGLRRELEEEAGILCDSVQLAGTISWPGFGKNGQDWFGFIFRIDAFRGEIKKCNPEGELLWVPVDEVLSLPLWEGDHHFLPLVFGKPARVFHGVMPYDGGKPVSWNFQLL